MQNRNYECLVIASRSNLRRSTGAYNGATFSIFAGPGFQLHILKLVGPGTRTHCISITKPPGFMIVISAAHLALSLSRRQHSVHLTKRPTAPSKASCCSCRILLCRGMFSAT